MTTRRPPRRKASSPALDIDRSHRDIADAIAKLFMPYVEVALHDLDTQQIIYLANNLSRRSVGDDSGMDRLKGTAGAGVIGPYEKLNWDGGAMRCISIRLPASKEGSGVLMCINVSVSALQQVKGALDLFLSASRVIPQPPQLFDDDWQERINVYVNSWSLERGLAVGRLSADDKKALIEALDAQGAFRIKTAAGYVSNVLDMGRATLYKYLKETRGDAR
jgi:predicted transcriptional regulator YheO